MAPVIPSSASAKRLADAAPEAGARSTPAATAQAGRPGGRGTEAETGAAPAPGPNADAAGDADDGVPSAAAASTVNAGAAAAAVAAQPSTGGTAEPRGDGVRAVVAPGVPGISVSAAACDPAAGCAGAACDPVGPAAATSTDTAERRAGVAAPAGRPPARSADGAPAGGPAAASRRPSGWGEGSQRQLLARLQRSGLMERRDGPGLVRAAVHLGLVVATGLLVHATAGSGWRLAAMLVHGAALVSLFAPLHECIHYTAFRSRRLNELLAFVGGFALLLPPHWFRWFHLAHHRYTQDPARDPELARPKPRTVGEWLWHVSGVPYWRAQVGLLLALAAGRMAGGFVPDARRSGVVRQARLFLMLYAAVGAGSVVAGSTAALSFWLLPVLLGQPLLRLFLLAEHTGCPQVPDLLANTRTTFTTPPLRFLAWNMPYHAEHHLAPAVPFHALPAVHGLVRERLAVVGDGYLRVNAGLLRALRRGG